MRHDILKYWYRPSLHPVLFLLLPFSLLYRLVLLARGMFYRLRLFKTTSFDVPVIVVGNITVGGTGKTPFVIWLASFLRQRGFHPGIVSRGFGGERHDQPYQVQSFDRAAKVGDEALLLQKQTECPLVICANRVAAVQHLLQHTPCNIVISDDGLQHTALGRSVNILMVDGERLFGNKHLLPAGPLREPITRLRKVDFIVVNGGELQAKLKMSLVGTQLVSLSSAKQKPLRDMTGQTVHAVAGIGHPQRFFASLRQAGLIVIPHVFADHHLYSANDLQFDDALPIIMTEKDAVKCGEFADARCWYLPVTAQVNPELEEILSAKLETLHALNQTVHTDCCC